MVGISEKISLKEASGNTISQFTETFVAVGSTDPQQYQTSDGGVYVQVSGTATAITAIVERSTIDPVRGTPNWAPAMDTPITGNLTTGIPPFVFDEPSRAYWQVRITVLTGGNATVVISGEQA